MAPQSSPPACEGMLRKPGVAARISVGVRTLERMISTGTFPGPDIKVSSRILLWRESTVQRWIEERAQRPKGGAS